MQDWPMLIVTAVIFIAMFYFVIFRPQKKQKKQEEQLRNSIQVGDDITTIGGINGKIVSIKDDPYVIETMDHSKIKIMKWALQANNTVHDDKAQNLIFE